MIENKDQATAASVEAKQGTEAALGKQDAVANSTAIKQAAPTVATEAALGSKAADPTKKNEPSSGKKEVRHVSDRRRRAASDRKLINLKPIESREGGGTRAKKRRRRHPLSMNLFFAIIILVEILVIYGSSSGILNMVRKTVDTEGFVPDMLWLGIVCSVVGVATTIFLIRFFSAPIFTLGRAVNRVADGDFSVRLKDDKGFSEMRRINSNFNKMVEELSATEILQTDFVSNVSHEFKTPITAIEGYATLLDGSEGTTPEQAEYIEKILFNTRRLSALVGNILLLSKVDNQSIPDKKVEYRLDEQIRQALLSHEKGWTEKDCELDVELEEVTYFGNESLLFHVWSNLIGNAIKFGPRGGRIIITLSRVENKIIFSVSDEGAGVSDEAKKHIFDRFYQSDSSHKSEGNGLGLALVKQIVKLEGGRVSVGDAEIGGAKFTVALKADIPEEE